MYPEAEMDAVVSAVGRCAQFMGRADVILEGLLATPPGTAAHEDWKAAARAWRREVELVGYGGGQVHVP
jgi:hypothetical protein